MAIDETEEATRALRAADAAVRAGIGPLYPGAVLMVAQGERVLLETVHGDAQTLDCAPDGTPQRLAEPRAMRRDTLFDLASITKVAATTLAAMRLVTDGRLALEATLGTLLPGLAATDKATITVRQLLTHRAGLWEWQPTWLHRGHPGGVRGYLAALPRRYPIGARHAYSDLGFMLLGEIVAQAAGVPLHRFVRGALHAPLGLADMGFRPKPDRAPHCAATTLGDGYQRRMAGAGAPFPPGPIPPAPASPPAYRTHVLVGEANDANVALGWEGVAGHAGLFAAAPELLRLAQALALADPRIADKPTFAAFEARPFDPDQALGLRAFAVPGPAEPFLGHTGFTGTFFAYHRGLRAAVVLLTNRVHRDDRDQLPPPVLSEVQAAVLAAVTRGLSADADPATASGRGGKQAEDGR